MLSVFYWTFPSTSFLGGLSLHLNHLTASHMANYDWPFGTLPFGLFWSNLDTRDLERYPRSYSGHFWNMSIFDDSRAIWVLFRKWVVSENHILLGNGWPTPGYSDLILGGKVPRLNHGPICFPIQNISGMLQAVESPVPLFIWFKFTLKPPYSIMHDKLWMAILETSFWTFWVKFGHKGPWDIS